MVSAKEILRNFKGSVKNGLCIFTGNILLPNTNTIKKLKISFEPFKKITSKLYNCGDIFDTSPLERLVESHESYGFIIVDGNGVLFGKL